MAKWLLSIMLLHSVSWADPVVIAHRGASGYLPEHTLEAVTLAHSQNADFIEQDVVLSKDNIPVVLHDIHLDTVTNVARLFPERKRADNRFYAIDFTLAELKTLTVHERKNLKGQQVYPNRYTGVGQFQIATLREEIELITQLNRQTHKQIGFYPEIKSPAWHRKQGKDISKIVLGLLREFNLDHFEANIYVQCFDFTELKRIRQQLGAKLKLVQLLAENDWKESDSDYSFLKSAAGLKAIADVAQGVGPWIPQLVTFGPSEVQYLSLVQLAHQNGLSVHPYTHRVDSLPDGVSSSQLLDSLLIQLRVDGIFSDFPDQAKKHIKQLKIKDD